MPLRKPTVSPTDPRWVRELKAWMTEAVDYINALPTRGDGSTVIVRKGVITALPQFAMVILTGDEVSGISAHPCDVYTISVRAGMSQGIGRIATDNRVYLPSRTPLFTGPYPTHFVPALYYGPDYKDTSETDVTNYWWALSMPMPAYPDHTSSYGLMSIAGELRWVWAGECGVTTTAP